MQIVAVTDPMQVGFSRAGMIGICIDGDAESVAKTLEAMPEVDYLVVCAGRFDILAEVVAEELGIKLEDIRALLDRNLVGTMLMCQAIVPGMDVEIIVEAFIVVVIRVRYSLHFGSHVNCGRTLQPEYETCKSSPW